MRPTALCSPWGNAVLRCGGRLGLDPRHQSSLLVLQQRPEDRLDLDGRFSLSVDDLGKSTPHPAMQVHFGEAARILVRMKAGSVLPLHPAVTRPSRTAASNCLSSCESMVIRFALDFPGSIRFASCSSPVDLL